MPSVDLEADEVAHRGASGRCVALGGRVEPEHALVPDVHAGQDHLDRDLQHGVEVGTGGGEVLADDHEGRAGHAGLDAVHVEVELVARLVQVQPVGEEVVLDLPLAEDPHDLDLALGAPHEELLVVDGEGDVAVVVEVRAARPRSTSTSRTRPRSGCSSGGGGKLGSDVGSVMGPT